MLTDRGVALERRSTAVYLAAVRREFARVSPMALRVVRDTCDALHIGRHDAVVAAEPQLRARLGLEGR